jgi:hypothetical protein
MHEAELFSKYCRSKKRTMLTTYIEIAMKRVYDKNKLPRSALSLSLYAAEAVSVLCPLSSWVAYFSYQLYMFYFIRNINISINHYPFFI